MIFEFGHRKIDGVDQQLNEYAYFNAWNAEKSVACGKKPKFKPIYKCIIKG